MMERKLFRPRSMDEALSQREQYGQGRAAHRRRPIVVGDVAQ